MTFTVGLTGGIGCGKSQASQFFAELGINIIDTDIIAHTLTQPDTHAIHLIQDKFGDDFIAADRSLNRKKMRELIFSDNDSRLKLEKILHPLIMAETARQVVAARSPYIIIVIPLLFETGGYNTMIQRTLVIDCEECQQVERTMQRNGFSEKQVRAIMAAQISRKERLQNADDVICNNRDISYLKEQITQQHHNYLIYAVGRCINVS